MVTQVVVVVVELYKWIIQLHLVRLIVTLWVLQMVVLLTTDLTLLLVQDQEQIQLS